MRFWVENIVTYFGKHYLNLCFLLHVSVLLLYHLLPTQLDGHQISHLHANKTPADCFRHTVEEGMCKIIKVSHKG